jgi:hypothetical protein
MQGETDERDEALRWWDRLCRKQAFACLEREAERAGGAARLLRWEVTARQHLARCARSHQAPLEADLDTAV